MLSGVFKAVGKGAVRATAKPKNLVLEAEKAAVDALDPKIARPTTVRQVTGKESAEVAEESKRVLNLDFENYKLDDSAQPNFDVIDEPDEIKAVIADFGERNKVSIDQARRNVISDEQLRGLAEDLDVKEDVVREVMTRDAGGKLPSPEVILASRQVLNSSAERIHNLAKKISDAQATDIEKLQFKRQLEFHRVYMQNFMGIRAEAGRSLRAFGIPMAGDDTQIARMHELVETVHGHDVEKVAKAISSTDSIQGVNKIASRYTQSKIKGVLEELFINSILSGIKTHVVNTSGNALFVGMNLAERGVASQIGKARVALATRNGAMLSPEEMVFAGEVQAQLYGTIQGFRDGMRLAAKAFRRGEASDQVQKLELPIRKAISAENLEVSGLLGRAVDFLGSAIRVPTERFLTAEDEFFKAVAMRGDLARNAYREAMQAQATHGLTDEQTAGVLKQIMDNPPDELLAKAHDAALYATFQNPLGPTGQKVQGFINKVPGLKFLAPFVRTPVNLFKDAFVERTPLGLFSRRIREQIAKGGPERDLALARISMGTLTASSIALAAGSGMITGGGPSSPAARKALQATGWKPYSMRVVGPDGKITYQSYARAEPLAFIIGATADAVEIVQFADIDPALDTEGEQANMMMSAIVAGIAENTMSKTFLSGLSQFNEAISDPQRYLAPWLKNMASASIPYSAFRRDLSRIQDPIIREAWTMGEKLRVSSGIPGWSEKAPAKLDIFGEQQYHPQGTFLGVVSPYPDKKQTVDPVKLEVAELMEETNLVPVTMPSRRISGVRLSAKEYHDYIHLSRKKVVLGNKTFLPALRSLMRKKIFDEQTPDTKVDLIKSLQREYDEAAREMLLSENRDLSNRVDERKIEILRRKFGDDRLER